MRQHARVCLVAILLACLAPVAAHADGGAALPVHVGTHPGYGRVVFDLPERLDFHPGSAGAGAVHRQRNHRRGACHASQRPWPDRQRWTGGACRRRGHGGARLAARQSSGDRRARPGCRREHPVSAGAGVGPGTAVRIGERRGSRRTCGQARRADGVSCCFGASQRRGAIHRSGETGATDGRTANARGGGGCIRGEARRKFGSPRCIFRVSRETGAQDSGTASAPSADRCIPDADCTTRFGGEARGRPYG